MSSEHEYEEHHEYGEHHDHQDHEHHEPDHEHHDGCGCHEPPECADCDPDLIDELKCQAEGTAAQAAYNAASQPALQQARLDYATTRTAYRTSRAAATLEVEELQHKVKQLVERIRCQIKQDDVAQCLEKAFRRICRRLDACGDGGGCCSTGDCTFDKTCPESYDELVSRIAEYQARLERDKTCFTLLIGEPAALTARVEAVKAEIVAITAALEGDQATLDLKKQYVAALVAQRHLDLVWNGFARTQSFIDCLCRALTCWTKGSDAISVLTGCKAVMDCQEAARQAYCDDLRTKTVDEVLMEYERLCGDDQCGDEREDEGEPSDDDSGHDGGSDDEDQDDDARCGCEHGHKHRRRHHRHGHRHD